MKLIADFHTHSKFSRFFHGKNSITEMAYHANELGLKELAITDHGFKHLFRTNKNKLYDARIEIDEINKWSKTKILLGIEADILDEEGNLDIDDEVFSLIDILVVGYHRLIKTDFANLFGKQNKIENAKQKATNAFLNAINKYPITIISHLNAFLDLDLYQIGKACEERGVFVEINNRHPQWTDQQMYDLIASGCSFVVSSDAHCREDVGEVSEALSVVKKYGIASEKLANFEFELDEMTEEHKRLNQLYQKYKEKFKQEEEIPIAETNSKKPERVGLSKEMEDELEKIAKEKGLNYTRPKTSGDEENLETKTSDDKNFEDDEIENLDDAEIEKAKFLDRINSISQNFSNQYLDDSSSQADVLDEEKTNFEEESEQNSSEDDENLNLSEGEINLKDTQNENETESVAQNENKVAPKPEGTEKRKNKNGVEINLNTKPVKEEKDEKIAEENAEKTDEIINLFSVNVSQNLSKKNKPKAEEEKIDKNIKESSGKKNKKGGFVNFSNLTEKPNKDEK